MINFSGIDAKLRRAKSHRTAIGNLADKAREAHRQPVLEANLDAPSGVHVFTVASVPHIEDLVEEISVTAADLVHNLRSALDHFAWELACRYANGVPADPQNVFFPVCTGLSRKGNPWHQDAQFIDRSDWSKLHERQPCKGTNGRPDNWSGPYVHQLKLLHDLWNHDKHVGLPVVLAMSNEFSTIPLRGAHPQWVIETESGPKLDITKALERDPQDAVPNFEHAAGLIEPGAEVMRIKITSSLKHERHISPAGTVFPRFALEDGRPLMPTLDRIDSFVQETLALWR